MLTNLWIDRLRLTKRRRNVPDGEPFLPAEAGQEPSRSPWGSTTLEDVRQALAEVPNRIAPPIGDRIESRSYHDLACELGVPTATVGTRISRTPLPPPDSGAQDCTRQRTATQHGLIHFRKPRDLT